MHNISKFYLRFDTIFFRVGRALMSLRRTEYANVADFKFCAAEILTKPPGATINFNHEPKLKLLIASKL